MKSFTSVVLFLLLSLFASPAFAHGEQTEPDQRLGEYQQLKDEFRAQLKEIKHIMMSAPATKDEIELKDALNELTNLEYEYALARAGGAGPQALNEYGVKYFEQVVVVARLQDRLTQRITPQLLKIRALGNQMQDVYPDLLAPDVELLKREAAELKAPLEPLTLGVERTQEFEQEVTAAVRKWQSGHPGVPVTLDVLQREFVPAALRILERRTGQLGW
jgi:hypothetical protein